MQCCKSVVARVAIASGCTSLVEPGYQQLGVEVPPDQVGSTPWQAKTDRPDSVQMRLQRCYLDGDSEESQVLRVATQERDITKG